MSQKKLTRRNLITLLGGATAGLLTGCKESPDALPQVAAIEPQLGTPGDLYFLSLEEVSRLIEARKISPIELTQGILDRIGTVDKQLMSYVTVTADRALEAAGKAEKELAAGIYRGPLHGIPVAAKDLFYSKGTRTMGGLAVYREYVPKFDATAVERLEAAGAILVGKLNLTEGAMAGYHPDFEIPRNPWHMDLWPGASSSGSGVAVAAGLCYGALGSDTGGSIRFPSMANGIVGLKPTYGRVSRHGVLPLAPTMDHVGPMTRSVSDAAIMLQAMAGYDRNDPTSLQDSLPDMLPDADSGISGMTIGYDPVFSSKGIDAGLVAAIEQALETLRQLGAEIIEVKMPEGTLELGDTWFPICAYEARRAHAQHFPDNADQYGAWFRSFLETGSAVTDDQYKAAGQQRAAFNRKFNALLESVDTLVSPAGGLTFQLNPEVQYGGMEELEPLFTSVQMYFTIPADFAGTPSLTVPCGFSVDSVPYALQFMGRRLSEPTLIRIGRAYQAVTQWHQRHPAV
jgi:amidase